MTTNALLEAALQYVARGWKVFPLTPQSKKPRAGSGGFMDATTDAGQIRSWWTETPDANIGIATGKDSNLTALDWDTKAWEGKNGNDTLFDLIIANGVDALDTLRQKTWSGGGQALYEYAPGVRNSSSKIGKDLDVRGDGGYIVVPPSFVRDKDGREGVYEWTNVVELKPLPAWLLALMLDDGGNGKARKPRNT